jgi:hypothetical protein
MSKRKQPAEAGAAKRVRPRQIEDPYPLGVRIPLALRDRLVRLAKRHHRSLAKEVTVALETYADEHERQLSLPPLPGDKTPH